MQNSFKSKSLIKKCSQFHRTDSVFTTTLTMIKQLQKKND